MYKFIDITESQSDTTLPSEAISVNGEYIEELLPGYRTLYTSLSLRRSRLEIKTERGISTKGMFRGRLRCITKS